VWGHRIDVLVRAILGDDPRPSAAARQLLEPAREIVVPVTVLLELAWVLTSVGWNRGQVHQTLATLALQPTA
jgi:predicted nucleic acid-binding protein